MLSSPAVPGLDSELPAVSRGEPGGTLEWDAGFPAAPNLTLILPRWSVENFTPALRTGVDPYNHTIGGMPWKQSSDAQR